MTLEDFFTFVTIIFVPISLCIYFYFERCKKKDKYLMVLNVENISVKKVEWLNCIDCNELISIPNIKGLKRLDCLNCHKLKDIYEIETLEYIKLINCPNLNCIPKLQNLNILVLNYCNIENISNNCIKTLYVWNCYTLRKIKSKSLKRILCINCPNLISIPKKVNIITCHDCKWIKFDKEYKSSIKKLKRLQLFVRNNYKYWLFKKVLKDKRFIEWIYDPNNIGGKCAKKNLGTFVGSCKVSKEKID